MGMFLRRGLAGRIALNITETGTTGLSKTQGYVTQRDLISKSMEKLCKPEVEHIGMS